MNKSDLINDLTKEADVPVRKAEEIVNHVFDVMSGTLTEGERIEIKGFGSFTVRQYGDYIGRNPKTGEERSVKPKKLPFFRVGKDFKKWLNQG
jgi:integration host factor subunit beta